MWHCVGTMLNLFEDTATDLESMFCAILEYPLKMLNSLLHEKILDWSIFKAFADDKINGTKKLKFVLE